MKVANNYTLLIKSAVSTKRREKERELQLMSNRPSGNAHKQSHNLDLVLTS